ncbi:hypothetical protein B0H17DRAFT_1177007 [Mycena rosella]|uniref:Uncharacterized protein n=1 Tax=Mycena rosella TaxID=1033263 RepID=A0AAD7GKX6_MYCRO|nr:hypothetical protein B0H17DRAFT_1177007 [Mycena rosella]
MYEAWRAPAGTSKIAIADKEHRSLSSARAPRRTTTTDFIECRQWPRGERFTKRRNVANREAGTQSLGDLAGAGAGSWAYFSARNSFARTGGFRAFGSSTASPPCGRTRNSRADAHAVKFGNKGDLCEQDVILMRRVVDWAEALRDDGAAPLAQAASSHNGGVEARNVLAYDARRPPGVSCELVPKFIRLRELARAGELSHSRASGSLRDALQQPVPPPVASSGSAEYSRVTGSERPSSAPAAAIVSPFFALGKRHAPSARGKAVATAASRWGELGAHEELHAPSLSDALGFGARPRFFRSNDTDRANMACVGDIAHDDESVDGQQDAGKFYAAVMGIIVA